MNLDEETRNGYTISKEMKKVWAVELQLLHKLLDVCQKYNLKIVACGGTCIGAVREHGFIPWDDDIDMEMLRPDYDKLISVAEKEFEYPYFFQCFQTEDHYFAGHAQLRMSNTTAIEKNDCRNINHGIPLDIFVLDAVPKDKQKLDNLRSQSLALKEKLFGYSFFDYSFYYGSIWTCIKSWLYVKIHGYEQTYTEFENLFRENKIKDSDDVATMAFNWAQFDRVRRTKHMMDKILWLPFEDTKIPVPALYDEILTKHFGDFMTPVRGGALHSGWDILDADSPYIDHMAAETKKNRRNSLKRKFSKISLSRKKKISKASY